MKTSGMKHVNHTIVADYVESSVLSGKRMWRARCVAKAFFFKARGFRFW
jgi:hypothetical protein